MLLEARTGASPRARPGRWPTPLGVPAEAQILLALTAVAAGLRFATLGSQSYWLDESQAAHELGLSFGSMLHAWSSAEWNPPLYLIVAWPWARVFGTGEVGLRALSAILGTALVPLLYLCGRELVSRRAGLVAAALAAVNPFMIWYSQEAREYMLEVVLCTAALLFFARAWRTRNPRDLAWWAVLSALALLTQYFAGFLIAAEGLLLLYRLRNRAVVVACALQLVVLGPLIPHVIPRLQSPALFITGQPLVRRLQQVPVSFGLYPVYQTRILSYGLLAAAALAAVIILLLLIGAEDRQLRGAGLAAALAGFVLLAPLVLALAGHDDYIARAVMPAWPALALVVGAACAAPRARPAGAALALALLALFAYGQIRVQTTTSLQRPNWRAVARALGPARQPRAVVAYDGEFATAPLSVYLPGVPWSGPGGQVGTDAATVTVAELDVVGDPNDQLRRSPGFRLISAHEVDGYQVDRFRVLAPRPTAPEQLAADAQRLLYSGESQALPVLLQPASA